jgi:hypothetical protein
MLRHRSEIDGYSIGASDGPIGWVSDFLFDDVTWQVRWLVVDTGDWFLERKVLLPPSVLGHVNHIARQFSVTLTRQQVKDSPDIDTALPISRLMEANYYDYFGWRPYWATGFYAGPFGHVAGGVAPPGVGFEHRNDQAAVARLARGDANLRSAHAIAGYHIHASDGEIGHLADLLVEDMDWTVRYLVIDTKNWLPGKKVLISPRSIGTIDWSSEAVTLLVDRQKVKDSPAYDGSQAIDRAYEYAFHGYYDHQPVTEPV